MIGLASAFAPLPARALEPWSADLQTALQDAGRKHSLVLLDFYAPWCYSCYYMDRNVLHQPELLRLRDRLALVKMDVDSPEGALLKRRFEVHGLPNYVVLDPNGAELGRIVGEQTRGDFIRDLKDILQKRSPVEALEALARQGSGNGALAAAREALHVYVQRRSAAQGLAFYESLAKELRDRADADPGGRAELYRLRLLKAQDAKNGPACRDPARRLLAMDTGCEAMYDISRINDCLGTLPEAGRLSFYRLELKPLNHLLESRIFINQDKRCADFRTAVELAAEVYAAAGKKDAADRVLSRAVDTMRAELHGKLGQDRNRADNLRVFLEQAGRSDDLDALYPELIRAYPEDYVYPYRYGRYLFKRGRLPDALIQLNAALSKSYGANKLYVLEQKARVLAALGRKEEALAAINKTLEENSAAFPDESASLHRCRDELAKEAPRK